MYKSEMTIKLKKWIIYETCKYDIFLFLHYSKIFYYVYFGENDDIMIGLCPVSLKFVSVIHKALFKFMIRSL